MELFRSTFRIAREDCEKAVEALRNAGLVSPLYDDRSDRLILNYILCDAGLHASVSGDCVLFDCDTWMLEETIDLMEKVFKAVTKLVEPGSYIEFIDEDTLVRYDFLYDTLERCTVPHILYTKREVI